MHIGSHTIQATVKAFTNHHHQYHIYMHIYVIASPQKCIYTYFIP